MMKLLTKKSYSVQNQVHRTQMPHPSKIILYK